MIDSKGSSEKSKRKTGVIRYYLDSSEKLGVRSCLNSYTVLIR